MRFLASFFLSGRRFDTNRLSPQERLAEARLRGLRPVVIYERCIGCGICENRCPVNGQAAILVYAPTDLSAIG